MERWSGRYECDPKNARIARHQVSHYARRWLDEAESSDVECAVGEALAAAVLRCGNDAAFVEVLCQRVGPTFVIDVTDAAGTFDLGDLESHPEPAALAVGYSILIMHELMDEVEYADRGRSIRLTKRCE